MSPYAKFWRTFAQAMVGVLASAALLANTGDYRTAAILLGLGVATAVLAGLVALALAFAGTMASSPIGKAVATTLQVAAAGFATVVFNSVTDLTSFPKLALTIGVGAVLAGLQTFAQNSAGG